MTSDHSVTDAAALIERQAGRLDVLVNNAEISGESGPGWGQDPTTLDLDVVRTVLETNVLGVIRVTPRCCRCCECPCRRASSTSPAASAP